MRTVPGEAIGFSIASIIFASVIAGNQAAEHRAVERRVLNRHARIRAKLAEFNRLCEIEDALLEDDI